MSAEMDKKRFGFAATARTMGYALGIIVRHQPLYLVFLLGAGLCKGLMPFIAVLLPKLVLGPWAPSLGFHSALAR